MRTLTTLLFAAWAIMSLACYAAMAVDKGRAVRGAWRIPERTLMLLAACFGAPGGLIAMRTLRHKNRKPQFRAAFPAFCLAQAVLIALTIAL